MNVYPFIEAEKAEQDGNVAMACRLLEVSRSAYYEWSKHSPSARELSDAELAEKIVDISTKSRGTYGAPRITTELAEKGICVGQKRVARLMVPWPGRALQAPLQEDHHRRSGRQTRRPST